MLQANVQYEQSLVRDSRDKNYVNWLAAKLGTAHAIAKDIQFRCGVDVEVRVVGGGEKKQRRTARPGGYSLASRAGLHTLLSGP
jgi:hypothetical protein